MDMKERNIKMDKNQFGKTATKGSNKAASACDSGDTMRGRALAQDRYFR